MRRLFSRPAEATERVERATPALPFAQVWGVRAATVGLWVLVAAGAVGGCASFVVRPLATSSHATSVPVKPPTVGAEGFAELYVATYLSDVGGDLISGSSSSVLKPFYPGDVDLHDVKAGALYVSQTVALDATQVSAGYWSVTVGARVLAASGGSYVPMGLRAYQVGVARSADGGYVATSVPGEVPLPRTAALPKLSGSLSQPDLSHGDINDAVGRFFAAFLAGNGELRRYVGADSSLAAVMPAPYVTVVLRRIALKHTPNAVAQGIDGYQARVEVAATDAAGRTQVLGYALELDRQQGQWEVRRLMPAAPLAHAATSGHASPTTTSTTVAFDDGPGLASTSTTTDPNSTADTTP